MLQYYSNNDLWEYAVDCLDFFPKEKSYLLLIYEWIIAFLRCSLDFVNYSSWMSRKISIEYSWWWVHGETKVILVPQIECWYVHMGRWIILHAKEMKGMNLFEEVLTSQLGQYRIVVASWLWVLESQRLEAKRIKWWNKEIG